MGRRPNYQLEDRVNYCQWNELNHINIINWSYWTWEYLKNRICYLVLNKDCFHHNSMIIHVHQNGYFPIPIDKSQLYLLLALKHSWLKKNSYLQVGLQVWNLVSVGYLYPSKSIQDFPSQISEFGSFSFPSNNSALSCSMSSKSSLGITKTVSYLISS